MQQSKKEKNIQKIYKNICFYFLLFLYYYGYQVGQSSRRTYPANRQPDVRNGGLSYT